MPKLSFLLLALALACQKPAPPQPQPPPELAGLYGDADFDPLTAWKQRRLMIAPLGGDKYLAHFVDYEMTGGHSRLMLGARAGNVLTAGDDGRFELSGDGKTLTAQVGGKTTAYARQDYDGILAADAREALVRQQVRANADQAFEELAAEERAAADGGAPDAGR